MPVVRSTSILAHRLAGPVHSLGLIHRSPLSGAVGAVRGPTVGPMRTELPAERLQRRLKAEPDTGAHAEAGDARSASGSDVADDDQNSLLPRWLPDASPDRGWVAR